jgi:hypothetical protein
LLAVSLLTLSPLLAARTPTPEAPLPVARPESLGLSAERLAYMGSYFG